MKDRPTLFDQLRRSPGRFAEVGWGPPAAAMQLAHRFVLDASASAFIGDLLRRAGTLVLREHEFARVPFPTTWIELDFKAYIAAIPSAPKPDSKSDTHVGYLYHNGSVYAAAWSDTKKHGEPAFSPYHFELHLPFGFEEELAMAQAAGYSRLTYRQVLLGTLPEPIDSRWWMSAEAADICRSHRIVWDDKGRIDAKHKNLIVSSSAGELKQVLALALLLTRPGQRVITVREQGHRRSIIRGKPMVLAKHNVITLHMKQEVAVRRFISGLQTGLHRREHDVRGHWAQTRRFQTACTHVWEPTDLDHYQCLRCQAKRWWRTAHKRGSNEIGTVTKDYEVTE